MTSINAGGVNMLNALKKLEWPYEILGKNYKWDGWRTRMLAYADFCDKQEDPNTIVVLVDAYDALPIRSPTGFEELFESFQSDLVIGAEHFCWFNCRPLENYWLDHSKENRCGNYFVQGGCNAGRAHALSKMYRWCLNQGHTDDQIGISHYVDSFPDHVYLDSGNLISFHDNWGSTGSTTTNEDTGNILITRKELETEPYFVHFPGFLAWSSLPLINWQKPSELKNYNLIGEQTLGDDFVNVGQVDRTAYSIGNTVGVFLIISLFFICVLLLIVVCKKKTILK